MKPTYLSTQPYKGTRDFYPEEMRFRKWLFGQMRTVVEGYGYEEYDGPILEPFDLYAAKTGEEIVNEQLYSFEDRGGRKVAIRPEMTPTLARMVAAKGHTLVKPIRWYSLPNLWRYERPQKGRLREHWQLNVDILGVNGLDAEVELLMVAIDIMKAFGASEKDFDIQINNRHLINYLFEKVMALSDAQKTPVARAIDKRDKISEQAFEELLFNALTPVESEETPLLTEKEKPRVIEHVIGLCKNFLNAGTLEDIEKLCGEENRGLEELKELFNLLEALGLLPYCRFSPTIMRGFDYYTGTVFEIFDRSPDNRRALFGGGRYDNLISLFGQTQLSGVGFGMGDVTLKDFLQTHHLLPTFQSDTQILVALFTEELKVPAYQLAHRLRVAGFKVETVLESGKIGKQYQYADKKGIPIVLLIGPDEYQQGEVVLKNLKTGEQQTIAFDALDAFLWNHFQE